MFRALALLFLLWMPLACTQSVVGDSPLEVASNPEVDVASSVSKYDSILQCVQENHPAERYFTNAYLPDPDAAWKPMECEAIDKIKVGMPWVLNDEEAPWYNAIEEGYYADVCLEVELIPGGPGVDHLLTLAGGAVDIATPAGGVLVPGIVYSETPADIVAVGAVLQQTPYIWLGLDHDTPRDQRSTKEIKPQDFIGKKIGLHANNEYLYDFVVNKFDLPAEQIEILPAGFTPDPVVMGAVDYIGAWIMNQPRLLEEQGYKNWTAFRFSEKGFRSYSDVVAVTQQMLDENPDLVRRYLAATYKGLEFLLENPDKSAEYAVKWGTDAQVTKEQALRRFELQEPLIVPTDGRQLMSMTTDEWDHIVAQMIEYGQLESATCSGIETASTDDEYRVAFFLADSPSDNGWNMAHVVGIREAASVLGTVVKDEPLALEVKTEAGPLLKIRIIEKNFYTPNDIERRMDSLIREWEPDLLFGTWWDSQEPVVNLANKYPDILFDHCSSYPFVTKDDSPYDNLSTYFVRMYEADYVNGALAAMMYPGLLKRGLVHDASVGLVATYSIPEPVRGVNAFADGFFDFLPAGVEGRVDVLWMNSWLDRDLEQMAAQDHIASGHSFVRQMADTPTSSMVAHEAGVIPIGYGNDVTAFAPSVTATNSWGWAAHYERRIREAMMGSWEPEDAWCGLADGCVRIEGVNEEYMTDEIREALLALISDISSGRVRPLSGPLDLYDGNGTRIHVPAGQALSDMDLLTMQTFIAGVHGEAPKMQEGATLELVSVGGP